MPTAAAVEQLKTLRGAHACPQDSLDLPFQHWQGTEVVIQVQVCTSDAVLGQGLCSLPQDCQGCIGMQQLFVAAGTLLLTSNCSIQGLLYWCCVQYA